MFDQIKIKLLLGKAFKILQTLTLHLTMENFQVMLFKS